MNSLATIRSLFILLVGIFVITSCLELNGDDESIPAELAGKWRLVRVEETVKTVSQPTPEPVIWIEFTEVASNNTNQSSFPYSFSGEAMVNSYFGGFNTSGASLQVSDVASTEKGGEVSHMAFDDYYFGKLANAQSYYIHENNKTLVVTTKEKHLLIFTRYDNAE